MQAKRETPLELAVKKPAGLDAPSAPHILRVSPYFLAFGVVGVLVAAAVGGHIRSEYQKALDEWKTRQSSIADERSRMVSEWLKERMNSAGALASQPLVVGSLAVRKPHPAATPFAGFSAQALAQNLDRVVHIYGYASALVLDRRGQVQARSAGSSPLDDAKTPAYRKAADTGKPQIDVWGDAPDKTLISFSTPVFGNDAALPALGTVVVLVRPAETLFPVLTYESVPTRSGETVLVRKEGEEVVFIAPVRHQGTGEVATRRPYAISTQGTRAALEGREEFGEFTDYRGVWVLAATRRIPATGWGLVCKIDRAEALADFRRRSWLEALGAASLLAALASLLVLYRRYGETIITRKEGEKFRALVKATAQIVWTTNPEGEVEDIPEWRAFTGQSPQEVRGSGWKGAVHPEDAVRVAKTWSEAVASRSFFEAEYRLRRKDGEYRFVSARGVPILETDGTIREWVGFCADITEREQTEESLRRANAYNRSLIEASLDPLVTISPDGKITDVNTATEKVTGRARTELIGTDFSDYFTNPDKARAGYQRVFREGAVQDYELEIRHPDGHITPVLYNAVVYRDETARVIGVFAAARDITERKRAEEQLAVQARISEIFLTVPDDEMYNEVLKAILKALESEHGVFGYVDEDEALVVPSMTRHIWDKCQVPDKTFVFPRATWGSSSWVRAILEKKPNFTNELSTRTPAGHIQIQRHISLPIMFQGEVIGLFQVANKASDYTEADVHNLERLAGHIAPILNARLQRDRQEAKRRQAEEEVKRMNQELDQRVRERTAELEATNKELEAFTYSVSHDLRAPLRHVDGFANLLVEEFGPGLPEQAHHFLDRIQSGTHQMGQLVDDLLNLSRIGRRELSVQITGLNSLVQEVVSELKAENRDRKITWKVAPLPFVECDPTLMKQALTNLLSNAVKFTRPREEAVIEVGTRSQDGSQAVFVRDNGVGFNMKFADKLFGVFQRLHRSEDFEGTGVGLATVKRIVQKHYGQIWAEGELDRGATFYFTLGSGSAAAETKKDAA